MQGFILSSICLCYGRMDSLASLIFTGLILNKFLAIGWFCVELLLYPTFLNNRLTLQASGEKLSSKMFFKLVLTKSFSQNVAIWPDAKDIVASNNWKTLQVFAVIWIFLCSRKAAILLFDRNKSIIKVLLS